MTQKFVARFSALIAIAGALAMGPKQVSAEPACMGLMEAWFWAGNGECPSGSSVCANAFPSCGEPTSGGCTAYSNWTHWGSVYPGNEPVPEGVNPFWGSYIACYYGES
jgi:hypothetical protein